MEKVIWADLGLVDYHEALLMQDKAREFIRGSEPIGLLLFLEHPDTITLGLSLKGDEGRSELVSDREELQRLGVEVIQVDRGGKATYHGPGQVVGYPIMHLKRLNLRTKRYMGKLQGFLLAALKELGLEPGLDEAYPGVWVGGSKIAAVGVRVSDGIASHGFALNLEPDLSRFKCIVPCGIRDRGVTSIKEAKGQAPERRIVVDILAERFGLEFGVEMIRYDASEVRLMINKGACQ